MPRVVFFALFWLATVACPAFANEALFTGQDEILRGLDYSYRLRFTDAKGVFSQLATTYPASPAGRFYVAAVGWGMTESDARWRIMASFYSITTPPKKQTRDAAALEDGLGRVIVLCDAVLAKKPDDFEALFYKAGAHAFLARMYAYGGDYFDAMTHGKKSAALFDHLYALYPNQGDAMIGPAIYKYHVGKLPAPLRWLVGLLGLSGTKEEGLALAEKAYDAALLSRVEAADFLARTYAIHESNPHKALEWAVALERASPGTMAAELDRFYAYHGLGDAAKEEAAVIHLSERLPEVDAAVRELWEPLLYYVRGSLREKAGDRPAAAAFFRKALAFRGIDPWLKGDAELKLRRTEGRK
ncbi:MAG: hypothetical protein HZA03_02835 [Nitrospinae bacterium]|nr:hypothetical protein [Nitrospinota bacterium]